MSSLQESLITRVDAASELLARRRARGSMLEFCRYIHSGWIDSDFSASVCAALDGFLGDMIEGKRPKLILAAPPQHGKSELVSRLFPAYVLGRLPELRLGALSYSMDLASRMNRDVQSIMMGSRYQNLFPKSFLEKGARRNSREFEISAGLDNYKCAGVGGPLTGFSLDLGIIDDPIKNALEARSVVKKSSVWDWYTSTFLTRLSENSGQIIMATRWAVDDLSGRVLDLGDVKHMSFRAIEDGKALVPGLHSLAKLLDTKKTMSDYFWSALYQNSPIPDDGGDFDVNKIEIVDALPAGVDWVRGWDFAASTKKHADYTASALVGLHGGLVYIGDVEAFQKSPADVFEHIKLKVGHDGDSVYHSFPQDPAAAGMYLANTIAQMLHGVKMEFSPESGDKRTRAMPLAAQVGAGNVRMLRGPWNDKALDQLAYFPSSTNDDMVDALSRAYSVLVDRRTSFAPVSTTPRTVSRVQYR